MKIRQMRYFLSVCQTHNMTKSADLLYVSQPTLSLAIKELEQEVGQPLFYRNGNQITLTPAGTALREEIKKILYQYDQLQERIMNGGLNQNHLHIGFSPVIGNTAAARFIRTFHNENPDVQIFSTEDSGSQLLSELEKNNLDAVITGTTYIERKEWRDQFMTIPLPSSIMQYYVPKNHIFATKNEVTLEEIASHSVILLDQNYPVMQNIEKLFTARGLQLKVILRTSQIYTVENFISENISNGFLPSEVHQHNDKIVPIHCPQIESQKIASTALYYKKEAHTSPIIQSVLKTAEQMTDKKK